jgi:hypothetical protein
MRNLAVQWAEDEQKATRRDDRMIMVAALAVGARARQKGHRAK